MKLKPVGQTSKPKKKATKPKISPLLMSKQTSKGLTIGKLKKDNRNTIEGAFTSLPEIFRAMISDSNLTHIKIGTSDLTIKFNASDKSENLLEIKSKSVGGVRGKTMTITSKRSVVFQSNFISNATYLNMK